MLILTGSDIESAVPGPAMVDAVEKAMLIYEGKDFRMPARMHFELGENVLELMPASTLEYFGTKLVSVFPGNLVKNVPTIQGIMVLNDGSTGKPLALMDASVLTGLRTGSVGAVGIKHLSDPGAKSLGIIGAGVQAYYQARMACHVRNFNTIHIMDIEMEKSVTLAERLGRELGVAVHVCHTAEELVQVSDVIITATTSHQPVVPGDPALLNGKTMIGIGSFTPAMHEYPAAFFSLLDRVFIDSLQATEEAGDLIDAIKNKIIHEESVFTLGKLIAGTVDAGSRPTRFFKSVGMALFDVVVSEMIYTSALEMGIGIEVDF